MECSRRCSCSEECRNRVVGKGVRVPLCVFYTSDGRGWGVRTVLPLNRGSFVCEYAGELISATEAGVRRRKRARKEEDCAGRGREDESARTEKPRAESARSEGMNFVFTILEHGSEGILRTTIDPTLRGNVGRYINHSCRPNLAPHLVRVGSLIPSIAFFCRRDVEAGEELTFSYHEGIGASDDGREETAPPSGGQGSDAEQQRRPCKCGATNCLGFLPFDPNSDG